MAGFAFIFKLSGLPDLTKEFQEWLAIWCFAEQSCGGRYTPTSIVSASLWEHGMVGCFLLLKFKRFTFSKWNLFCSVSAFPFGKVSKWVGSGLQAGNVGIHENRVSMWLDHLKTDQLGRSTLIKFGAFLLCMPYLIQLVGDFLQMCPKCQGSFWCLKIGPHCPVFN